MLNPRICKACVTGHFRRDWDNGKEHLLRHGDAIYCPLIDNIIKMREVVPFSCPYKNDQPTDISD